MSNENSTNEYEVLTNSKGEKTYKVGDYLVGYYKGDTYVAKSVDEFGIHKNGKEILMPKQAVESFLQYKEDKVILEAYYGENNIPEEEETWK